MVPSPRRLPHTISLLEGDGFELLVPGREGQTVIRDGTAVSKTGADLLGNRRFESICLRRRVRREPEFVAPGPPNAKLLRVVAITDDLDFLKAQPARVPTRKELARIAVDGRVRVRPGS